MADDKNEGKQGKQITIKIPSISIGGLKQKMWMLVSAILALMLALIWAGLLPSSISGSFSAAGNRLSSSVVAQRAIDYINSNLVQSGEATLVRVEEVSGLYKITTSYQGQTIYVYATSDGKWLITGSEPLDMTIPLVTETTTTTTQPAVKSEKPEAHAFIMSYCPYGLQFLKAYIPVIELLGDKADLSVDFVNYAMHGKTELDENLRMYCIQKEQEELFTEYARCFVKEGDSEGCIDSVGIDRTQLESCTATTDAEYKITEMYNDQSTWLSGAYPLFPVEDNLNEQYSVGGSPTFILNGQEIFVARSAEAIKEVVCSAFTTQPAECSQQLSTAVEASGLGAIGAATGASSTSSCG